MRMYYYCLGCKRIFNSEDKCPYCSGESVRTLHEKSPVSVMATKQKGYVLSTSGDMINVLIHEEGNNKLIGQYKAEQLKKVL